MATVYAVSEAVAVVDTVADVEEVEQLVETAVEFDESVTVTTVHCCAAATPKRRALRAARDLMNSTMKRMTASEVSYPNSVLGWVEDLIYWLPSRIRHGRHARRPGLGSTLPSHPFVYQDLRDKPYANT